jgi:hypothetical protein
MSNNTTSYDCTFIRDCEGSHHCFIGANLRNQSHVFMGEKLNKEEYEKKIKEIDLGSYSQYQSWKNKAEDFFKKNIPRPKWETLAINSSGSYVFQSKNCKECYDVTDCQDSKFLMLIKEGPVVDSFDYTDWGNNASLIYDSVTVGEFASDVKFSQHCSTNVENIEYSKLQIGGSNCFGCVSMKKGQYCILNKQYEKEEYFSMIEKIKKHMNDLPYIDSKGLIYKYGEFFPMEFSPHSYNNSLAHFFFPKLKEEVIGKGLKWYDLESKDYPITKKIEEIPDHINDVRDDILNEVIQCSKCIRGFKIIHQELQFLRKQHLPLPRECPFCRVGEKISKSILTMKIYNRECYKCKENFTTHYNQERAPIIYCIDCYKKEYY